MILTKTVNESTVCKRMKKTLTDGTVLQIMYGISKCFQRNMYEISKCFRQNMYGISKCWLVINV